MLSTRFGYVRPPFLADAFARALLRVVSFVRRVFVGGWRCHGLIERDRIPLSFLSLTTLGPGGGEVQWARTEGRWEEAGENRSFRAIGPFALSANRRDGELGRFVWRRRFYAAASVFESHCWDDQ